MTDDITSEALSVRIADSLIIAINNSDFSTLLAYRTDCNIILFYHFRILFSDWCQQDFDKKLVKNCCRFIRLIFNKTNDVTEVWICNLL